MKERKVNGFSENIPLLGFGMMRMPMLNESEKKIDVEQVKKMTDIYMNTGMNYFDTAYMYHDGNSERIVKQAVCERYPRESFLLADKLPTWSVKEVSDLERIFREQLDKTGAGYFDFYLIHAMNKEIAGKCDRMGIYDFMKSLKKDGRARHIGFSFHDTPAVLEEILAKNHEFLEFVQLQINYFDWNDEVRARECYEIARKYNKPVIIMEPVKGGTLANVPEDAAALFKAARPEDSPASWAMRFCGSLDGIMTVLSGMSDLSQMEDNIKTVVNFEPISEKDREVIEKALPILKKAAEIPCTGCKYCIDCPMMIDIPANFTLYNEYMRTLDIEEAKRAYKKLNPNNEAGQCIACKRCEELCPQAIKVSERIKDAAGKFAG